MPEPMVQDTKAALEDFATGLQQAATREEFDTLLDDWVARGFPEAEAYRGGFARRGEIIAEAMKTMRALDGDARAMAEAERDRLPALGIAERLTQGVAVGTVASAGAVYPPYGAGAAGGTTVADIAGAAARVIPRAASAAAAPGLGFLAGLGAIVVPSANHGDYEYFGPDGRYRVWIPPGLPNGYVEGYDPVSREWYWTGERASKKYRGSGDFVIAVEPGRPEGLSNRPVPQHNPGLVPPILPDTSRETFPSDRAGGAETESFPAGSVEPEIETFPVPDDAGPQILIFPDMSDEFRHLSTLESRRGNDYTRDHLDQVRDWFLEQHPGWEHHRGGRDRKDGESKSEYWIPGPGHDFLDKEGRRGDGRPGGKWADLTFRSPDGRIVHVQTVDVDKNGKPTDRELQNAEMIRRRTGATVYLIPKPAKRQ